MDGVCFYLIVFVLIIIFKRKKEIIWRFGSLAIALLLFISFHFITKESLIKEGTVNIVAIDIGQGDSYLIVTPSGKSILIDAGALSESYDAGANTVKQVLKKLGITRINYAFISHYDNDHAGGMISLLLKSLVENLYLPPPDSLLASDIAFYNSFIKFIKPIHLLEGVVINNNGFKIESLTNYDSLPTNLPSNSRSAVLKMSFNHFTMLFTGDLDRKGERRLIKNNLNLKCDLLKISHHGSKSGTSDSFLELTSPTIAVISAGVANRYNHPSKETIDRLEKQKSGIFRTDLEGCLIFRLEDNKLKKVDWR
jgi:competence protein ComEC